MGTNYYVRYDECECCGMQRPDVHIGKDSVGWQFSFYRAPDIAASWKDWKEYLEMHTIVDEYEREISLVDFIHMVESNKIHPNNKNHTVECWLHPEHWEESSDIYLDDEGHSFSRREFS